MSVNGIESIIADLIRQPRPFVVKLIGDAEPILVAAGADATCFDNLLTIRTKGNTLHIPLSSVAYINVAATFSVDG